MAAEAAADSEADMAGSAPLMEIGASHWGYIHTGFEPKHIWAFVQSFYAYIEHAVINCPDFEARMFAELHAEDSTPLVKVCLSSYTHLLQQVTIA